MPSTLAPTTNVPSTVASLSTAPTAAPAPSRRENVTDLIEDSGVKEVAKAIGTVVPVVVGTAALAGNSGGSGNRLLLVVSGCYTSAKHDFPFVFHPTSLVILESPAFGMVVGNLLLNAGFSAFCFLVLSAGRRFHAVTSFPHLRNLDIQGFLRLPSLPLLVFALLYQGSALGSMALIYDPPSTIAFVVGLCSAAFCVIVPVLVVCEVQKSVPSLAFFKEDDRYTGFGWRMAIGNGEWVSTTPKVLWAHRFQSVLTMYSEDKAWFGSMRFGSSFALAALSAPVTENSTSCGHVKLCSALVVLMELATMSWVWPYAKSRDALADMVTTLLEAGGMLFMAAGYYVGDLHHWTHSTATILLTAAMFTVGIRVLLDLGTEAFVFFTERRARLQELVFLGCRSGDGGVLGDVPSSNEPRGFGKEKSTSITLQLPDNSQGGGIELSPRGSMFSTEATALKLSASARQLSASLISSSPSDFVFTPLGDDPMDGALLVSPTLSYTSVLGDGRFSSSLRSPRRSSPRVHSPVTPVGRRSQRLASMGIKPLLVPLTSSPESHLHGLDDRRQQRSSFLSPLAEVSPPPAPQIRRNLSSTVTMPLSASCRLVRKSQPMPQTTSASTPSEAQPPPRRRRAYTVRTASTAAGLSANGRDRGSPLTSYEHSRAAV
ncbi:hypothetical protein DIPPA_20396 [Diplonema papillatum]|nr:hypothetical protein DIPPA_20396 [Diplonema papillatum]